MQEFYIIPKPTLIRNEPGVFRLDPDVRIVTSNDLRSAALVLRELVKNATKIELPIEICSICVPEKDAIVFTTAAVGEVLAPHGLNQMNGEGYVLDVTGDGICVRAFTPRGAFYAVQSLRQMLPLDVEDNASDDEFSWELPCARIIDAPRFAWRGLHLDCARHFFPVNFIKRYIDLLAMHKMNTFHWHLTEDQGWRIEIKRYPDLTRIGSRRSSTPILADPTQADGQAYEGFYTQAEVREVVAYAAERFVTVVPEIEMPGHSLAALASYPHLGCTGGPYKVRTQWGIEDDVYCAGNDAVFEFLEGVLDEVLELFPSTYIHIGGDECPKTRWRECPKCQERIKVESLTDEDELQSYFIRRVEKYLSAKGRRLIGWDEILEGGLAPGATVMSWRGTEGGIQAAQAGHDVVMTPFTHCYFDYYQSEDLEHEPPGIGGFLPLENVYAYEPVPEELDQQQAKFVIGAQGNVWTEYIPTPAQVEYMAYPRGLPWRKLSGRQPGSEITRNFHAG